MEALFLECSVTVVGLERGALSELGVSFNILADCARVAEALDLEVEVNLGVLVCEACNEGVTKGLLGGSLVLCAPAVEPDGRV